MRAGLLVFDHAKQEYQQDHGDYPAMFEHLFPSLEWIHFEVMAGQLPKSIDECEVYFGTGSRHSVYEALAWIEEAQLFLQELHRVGKKYVGFCFGHQMLAAALGGKVEKAKQGWCVGVHRFSILEGHEQAWMLPKSESLNLLMMCQDQVVQLPPGAKCLASSEICPIGMFQVGTHMLGVQAHPEFSKDYDRVLMESRIDIMGEIVVSKGLESLGLVVHKDVIQKWVLRFLEP